MLRYISLFFFLGVGGNASLKPLFFFCLDLDAYLDTWKTEVADLINENMSNFDATTQAALQAYIESNLGSD